MISASRDYRLTVWDPTGGGEVASVSLIGPITAMAVHPTLPIVVCGDEGGSLYLVDLVGIEYGPIVVTAIDRDGERTLRCPKCWQVHRLDEQWLGQVIGCPTPTCGLRLRVNPFVVGRR